MQKFVIGEGADAQAELLHLLEYNSLDYRREGARFRLVFASCGCKWETVCDCREQAVVLYGIYPFPVRDREKALSMITEINRSVLFGGMFLDGDAIVYRTCADLFDAYSAYEAIGRALEYNANVIVHFWRNLTACSQERAEAVPTQDG